MLGSSVTYLLGPRSLNAQRWQQFLQGHEAGPTGGHISQAGHQKYPVLPNALMQPRPSPGQDLPTLAAAGLPAGGPTHSTLSPLHSRGQTGTRKEAKEAEAGNPGAPG